MLYRLPVQIQNKQTQILLNCRVEMQLLVTHTRRWNGIILDRRLSQAESISTPECMQITDHLPLDTVCGKYISD
jgi:hypothetical protein